MKKATRDFAAWVANVKRYDKERMERLERAYERGRISLDEFIRTTRDYEIEQIREEFRKHGATCIND